MRLNLLLLAVLWSGPALAQTAFLAKRDYSAKTGSVRVKMTVSQTRKEAVELTVRLKGAGKNDETPGPILVEGVDIVPSEFKIPPGKSRKLTIRFQPDVAKRTPYFACVLYQPLVERPEAGLRTGGSMLLATESCSRFWVTP